MLGETRGSVEAEPFPHLVDHEAVRPEVLRDLLEAFPSTDVVTGGARVAGNQRFSQPAVSVLADRRVPSLWRAFVEAHVGQAFLDRLLDLFRADLARLHPDLDTTGLRAGLRGRDDFRSADVLLDAQLCVNTPVTGEETSVRGPHVDLPRKLFAGLFYLRPPEDDVPGGDLELYRFRGSTAAFHGQFAPEDQVEAVARIPYRANTLVLFLNAPHALHGVTPRGPSRHPRRFLNLVAEVERPLFDLSGLQTSEGKMPQPPRDGVRRGRRRRWRPWRRGT